MTFPVLFDKVQKRRTYAQYIASSISPLLWHRFRETSGTAVANSGSLGSAVDGVWTAGTGAVGQTGKLGLNEAYDLDGADSRDTIASNVTLQTLAVFTIVCLCKPDTTGELNVGTLSSDTRHQFRINGVNLNMRGFVTSNATAANTVTADGFVATGVWQTFFLTFDNAGDRRIRIYKAVDGVLTEASYTTQTAMTGTIADSSGNPFVIGGLSTGAQCFDGLIDEYFVVNRVLTSAEMQQIALFTA